MKRIATDGAGTAFLVLGLVFLTIGIPDDPAFVAVAVVFLAVGAAGVGRRSNSRDDSEPDG